MARKLIIELLADSSQLERTFKRTERNARTLSARVSQSTRGMFTGFAAAAGVSLGIAGATRAVQGMITAASDLNEQINRSNVVFQSSAGEIQAWSQTTATALGISQREALEASSNFGTMFNTIGLGSDQAASMSKRLVTLAADMASINNQDPSDMLDRLRSGLAGEAEPLRRFGVLLSEARVKQEAYTSGIAKHGATLTEQQKVQARYNLILRDSAIQQGDFARTSGGLANQQRILAALVDNLGAKLGTALLPQITELVTRMTEWLSKTKNQQRLMDVFQQTIAAVGAVIRALKSALDTLNSVTGSTTATLKLLFAAFVVFKTARLVSTFVGIAGNIGLIGTNATGAIGPVNKLKGALILMGAQAAIAMTAARAAEEVAAAKRVPKGAAAVIGGKLTGHKVGDKPWFSTQLGKWVELRMINGQLYLVPAAEPKLGGGALQRGGERGIGRIFQPTAAGAGPTKDDVTKAGVSAELRNRWFDTMIGRRLDRVQDIRSLQGQIQAYGVIANLIRDRIKITKDITRRQNLGDQLVDVLRTQRATRSTLTDQIKQNAEETAAAATAAKEAAAEARRAAIDRQFDWLDFALERAEATKTPRDNLKVLREREALLKSLIRSEGRTFDRVRELWRVRQQIKDLNKKNADDRDPLAGLMQVSSARLANILAAGTGLGVGGRRILAGNIAGAEIQPLHIHVEVDGREIGHAATKAQSRTAARTAKQTSGFRG